MGEITSWVDDVHIYGVSITSKQQAVEILQDTNDKVATIKNKVAIAIADKNTLRKNEDERPMCDIIADFTSSEDNILDEYATLSRQRMLLMALIRTFEDNEDKVITYWGHYDDTPICVNVNE